MLLRLRVSAQLMAMERANMLARSDRPEFFRVRDAEARAREFIPEVIRNVRALCLHARWASVSPPAPFVRGCLSDLLFLFHLHVVCLCDCVCVCL
jgi:hypothetical protein